VQTALRTITGWEGVTVSLENALLWVDQTYVVTYAAGYDDEGIEPTVDAYLIATDNAANGLGNTVTVDEHGVAEVTLANVPFGMDHTDADTLTGHVYVGEASCPSIFGDGSGSDGHVGMGVVELYARALYDSAPKNNKFKLATSAMSLRTLLVLAAVWAVSARTNLRAPEDELAKEMTHDLEMNFNKIAPFGKEDTAKELQDHAAKTQDTLVDAVENAEVAEIKRAVFRALTRLRAAAIKEFDTIARLETQAIDAYNDAHHYRAENPLTHLHEDEAPVETDKLKSFH